MCALKIYTHTQSPLWDRKGKAPLLECYHKILWPWGWGDGTVGKEMAWVRIPSSHIKQKSGMVAKCVLWSHSWGEREERISGAAGQSVEINWWTPGSVRDPVSKTKVERLKELLVAKSSWWSSRRPTFSSHQPHGGSQPPVTPIPGDPRSSSLSYPCKYQVHTWCAHTAGKIPKHKKCFKMWGTIKEDIQNQPLDCTQMYTWTCVHIKHTNNKILHLLFAFLVLYVFFIPSFPHPI